ncbi:NUDIX hydrolase [bacterium]|nr:NUDIX hydrolase [bacterium]
MTRDLTEIQLNSEIMADGLLLKAWRDEVRLPNGKTAVREYIRHPGAVVMIPVFPNGDTIMVRQFRYPLRQAFIELPAGKLDGNEPIEQAARRELIEEIGYEPLMLEKIAEFFPCIGYSNEKMWLFIAKDLKEAAVQPDHDEFLEIIRLPFSKAVDKVFRGEITDMKTIVGLLLGQKFLSK